ncbi:MAG: hypothetical protein AAF721_20310 [Myxococcota bacterium]
MAAALLGCAATGPEPVTEAEPDERPRLGVAHDTGAPPPRGPDARGCGFLDPAPSGAVVRGGDMFETVQAQLAMSPGRPAVDWVQLAEPPDGTSLSSLVIAHTPGGLRRCVLASSRALAAICDFRGEAALVTVGDVRADARAVAVLDHAVRIVPDADTARRCTPASEALAASIEPPRMVEVDGRPTLVFVEQTQTRDGNAALVRVEASKVLQHVRRTELLAWRQEVMP